MAAPNSMRNSTGAPAPGVTHLSRRCGRPRAARPVAITVTFAAALVMLAVTTAVARAASPAPSLALSPLPVVVAPTTPAASLPASTPAQVPPAPPPAPAATSPPGAVEGVAVPSAHILAPVTVLPAPARAASSSLSTFPLGVLAAALATLLIATGLLAQRRL